MYAGGHGGPDGSVTGDRGTSVRTRNPDRPYRDGKRPGRSEPPTRIGFVGRAALRCLGEGVSISPWASSLAPDR